MNISQLEYFITIVEENFNLSAAAEKLYVSQPALSNFIVRFEKNEDVKLFVRKNNRFIGLTQVGEMFYKRSRTIVNDYKSMMFDIRRLSNSPSGIIKIGIPPLIISVLFTDLIAQLIKENANIKFEIVEAGGYKLIDEMEQGNLDFAIVLHPNYVNNKNFNEVVLHEDELKAFISKNHKFGNKKGFVTWKELAEGPLAIFDSDFMIHHYVIDKFKKYDLTPNITIESRAWDFLVSVVRQANLITILPSPSENFTNTEGINMLEIEDPIPWNVSMIYPKKEEYSLLEKYIVDSISKYFRKNERITSIDYYENN